MCEGDKITNIKFSKAGFEKRFGAFFMDQVIISMLLAIIFLPLEIVRGHTTTYPLTMLTFFIAHCLKDIMNGASIGKRLLKLEVRCTDNPNFTPSWDKLIIRNLLTIIWPLEFIVLLVSKRKIGDRLAKTDVYVIPIMNTKE